MRLSSERGFGRGPGSAASPGTSSTFLEGLQYTAEAGPRLATTLLRLLSRLLLAALCQGTAQQAGAVAAQVPQLLRQLWATAPPDESATAHLQLLLAALVQSHKALMATQQGQQEGVLHALQARASAVLEAMGRLVSAAPAAFGGAANAHAQGTAGGGAASPPGLSPRGELPSPAPAPGGSAAAVALGIPEALRLLRPQAVLGGAVAEVLLLQAAGRAHEAAVQASRRPTCGFMGRACGHG